MPLDEMNETVILIAVVVLFGALLALPVYMLVRIGALPFSKRARGQVRRHPLLHVLWLVFAVVIFFL